nr:ribonuclease H-like domain-containing protein [Tanacetum cinerariifolium]
MFIDEHVESESVDVVSNVSSSAVKTIESKVKSVDVKNKGVYSNVETKPIRKNKFSPIIIEDWISDDESEVEFVSKVEVKTIKPSTEKETNAILLIIKIVMVDLFPLEMVKVEYLEKNGVAGKKNKTLIEATRTMALVIKPHNKTPYKLIRGRPTLIDFMKPFGCLVTILNTRDYLCKFNEKANKDFFIGYSVISKAMKVFNKRTGIVEKTLNIRFLKNTPNVKGNEPDWLFDIDSLTISMNYVPVVTGFQTNSIAGTKDNIAAGPKDSVVDAGKKATEIDESQVSDNGGHDDQVTRSEFEGLLQQERQTKHINNTNSFNTISSPVNTAGPSFVNAASPSPINAIGTPASEELGLIKPFSKSSCNCSDNSFISDGANRYGARATRAAPGFKSIWNSTGR